MNLPPTGSGREYVRISVALIEDSLAGGKPVPTVQALAARVGYSVHHFSRLFTAVTGTTPSAYLQGRILSTAAVLIRQDRGSLKAVSEALGFPNYEVFSRAFRRRYGVSPQGARLDPSLDLALTPVAVVVDPSRPVPLESPEPGEVDLGTVCLGGMGFYMDGTEKTFHRPWSVFSRHAAGLRGVREPRLWYQYAAWADRDDRGLAILCALEIEGSHLDRQPPLFTVRVFPPARYLRFVHTGGLDRLAETYQYIYGTFLAGRPTALAGCWEFQRFGDSSPGPLEILIPLTS